MHAYQPNVLESSRSACLLHISLSLASAAAADVVGCARVLPAQSVHTSVQRLRQKFNYFLIKNLILSSNNQRSRPSVFINEDDARSDLRSGFSLNSVTILHS